MAETDWEAFGFLAATYPHETYEAYPDLFWKFFREHRPGVSREQMERVLATTCEPVK